MTRPTTSAAATVSERLDRGKGVFVGIVHASELPEGWVEDERVAAGAATAYRAATDAAIDSGFVLAADREPVLADARPERLSR